MTLAEQIEPPPALPPRPDRALTTLQLWRTLQRNSLAAWDAELYEELFVERRFAWGRLVIVSDPGGIRRVLQDNYQNYPRLGAIRRVFAFTSGTGMLCAEGDVWRRHRRIINPTLDPRAIAPDATLIAETADEMARALAAFPADREFDLGATFSHLVTVSSRRVLATDAPEIEPMLDRMGHFPLKPSLVHFVPLPRWLPLLRRYASSRDAAARFAPMLDRLFAARRGAAYGGRRDLFWRLTQPRDGAALGSAELRDEAITLGATSSTTLRPLTWVWYLLATHPAVEERLVGELAAVLGGRAPGAEDLARLPYLRQVLDETMRLYPPLPVMIPRRATADDRVCGHAVRRGSIVLVMPWVLHRHRRLWRDPDRFDPDRFAEPEARARSRYSYLPFGIGPHVCVGASLAMMQLVIAVAILAQRFRFRLVPGQRIEPVAWINLRPRFGIRMTVEPRERGGS